MLENSLCQIDGIDTGLISPFPFLFKARMWIAPMQRNSSSRREPSICFFTNCRRWPEVTGKAERAAKVSEVQPAASAAVPFFSLLVACIHCL
eukprot:2763296-Amphidinium_carterae.1